MKLTNTERVIKVAKELVNKPKYVIPYLLSNLSPSRFSPLAQNMPWWSFSAIDAADKFFPGKTIFEWGSGGSTLRYSRMGCQITAIEDNPIWLESVRSAATVAGVLKNLTLCYVPSDSNHSHDFASSDYCQALSGSLWDVVIIDGQDNSFHDRITCFRHAEPLMKKGSIILVDDFWRYESLLSTHSAISVRVFESLGPCRLGVTSTAMFFY